MEEIRDDITEAPSQPGPTVAGLFGRLAAFTIAAGATTTLLRKGSRMAAKYITSKIPAITKLGGKEATGSLEGMASQFIQKTFPSIGNTTLSRDIQSGNRAYLKWAASWNRQDRIFKEVKYLEEGARHAVDTMEGMSKATDFHFNRMRMQTADFFARPGLGQRATGLAYQLTKKSLAGNAGAYVADQAMNIFSEPGERTGPAWYNPVGHAINFAKFTAQNLPYGLMFSGGLGYAAKMGAEAGIGSLKFLTHDVIGKANTQRALARTAAGADWIFKGLAGLHTAARQSMIRSQAVLPQDVMSLQFFKKAINPTTWVDFAREGMAGWKKGLGLAKKGGSTDLQFDAEIKNLITRSAHINEPQGRETFLRDFYTRTQKNRQSAFEYIFGLEKKVNFESELSRLANQSLSKLKLPGGNQERQAASDAFMRGWRDTSHLLGRMGVQVQPGVYKGVGNGVIDIRPIQPRRILNKVADVMNMASFRIPGINSRINVFEMFMIPNLIKKTAYEEWTDGAVFLGTNRTTSQRIGRSRLLSSNNPDAGALIENGWYAPQGGIGVFAGGGFYHYQDGSIRRLHTPRVTYKTFAKGSWGLMADTMAWLGGRYPQPLKETETGNRPFGKRVMEALDLDMTNKEGVFRRIGSHVRKYVWSPGNPHPNFIYDNIANFERSGDLASGQGFVRGIKHLVDDAVGVFSSVRTKRFTDAILGGSATNPNNLDDFRYVADRAREALSESNLHPYVRDLASSWNIRKIVDRAGMVDDYNSIRRIMLEPAAGGRKNYDQMIDFLSIDALSKKDSAGEVMTYTNDLVNSLQRKGEIGELGAASLRVISYGLSKQQQSTFFKNYLSQRGGTIRGENLQELTRFLKTNSVERDIKTVAGKIYKNPLKNFIDLDDAPYKSGMISNESKIQNLKEAPFVAIPWTSSGRMLSKELAAIGLSEENGDPRPKRAQGDILTGKNILWATVVRRMSNVLQPFDLGLNPAKYNGGGIWNKIGGPGTQMFIEGLALKRAGAIAGLATAYSITDRLVDVMPGLQNTPLGEGLTVFGADQFVKARMGVSWAADALGITSTAKYLEGLFPGMIDSPLMRAARGVMAPLWLANAIGHSGGATGKRLQWGLLGGMAMGAVQGFGMFDMTKNTAELKEIYSGREEIPIKRGRWWELGSSNYSGSRIRGFYPNWYARLKSQSMSTPEGWGSPLEQILYKPWPLFDFNPLGWLMGEPHHYAYQHYYSRPYPETGSAFYEFPFIGPALSSTLGRIMAPPKQMHKQELYAQLDKYGYSTAGGFSQRVGSIPGTSEMARAMPVSNFGIRQTLGNQLYNIEQFTGLWGFGLQTATQELMGVEQPYEGDNVLENAGEITSMRRQYYDKELGGLAGMSEAWRRFLPKRQAQVNRINPLQNRMPKWLPVQFRVGDAYAKTPWGELVLPGQGYTSAHDVEMTYPASADMLGLPLEETTRRMLSLGRPEPIGREELENVNARIKAAAEVYEPYNDVSGTYDGIIRKGRRAILQKIKNFNSQELTDVVGPTETDISEVNFYMRMAGVSEGIIQYRIDGVPALAYPVRYDEQRFQKDMDIVNRARRKAADLYAKGVGFEGMGYSHLDRASILANVAPYSNEFKQELAMAKQSVKIGKGDVNKLEKIKKHANAMKMAQEFYPRRFLGKVMTPDAAFNNMSLNEYMKAAAEYSLPERALGALWEGFNSLNHPFDKFHSYKTPLDAYKADTLYGRRIKMWQSPTEHWLDSMERGFMSKDDPMSGYLAGFIGGYVFGGGSAGSFLMSGIGAAYGTVHGLYRKVTGSTYIPGTVQETRNVNRYFDQMNYQKDMLLYEMTGNNEYLEGARSTMTGINPSDLSRQSWARFYRATPYQEKPYIMSFLRETDQTERRKILEVVPSDVGDVLASKWAKMDGLSYDREMTKRSMAKMPPPEWAGWAPEVNLDDVELKTVEQMGFEKHDFGLGWYEQERRIRNSPGIPGPINMRDPGNMATISNTPLFNQSEVRRSIERALEGMGVQAFISIGPSYSDNQLTVIG